jgi:hypothetical protein
MNAILFYVVPGFRLTGSTINAIEYFLAGFEHNPELKLYLINGTVPFRRKILKLINERYEMQGFTQALHNIICLKKFYLPSKKFDTVLILDYMTIKYVKGTLNAKNILVISEKYTELPSYFLDKSLYPVTYYGEMPFHYKDHEYRMKCLFNRYKPLKNVQKGTYVNSPNNNDFLEVQYAYLHLPRPFYFKSKTKPEENLFEKFTHYLYYHADKYFDPHPRLLLECRYYDKCITYKNPYNVKDGSWYRYNDLLKNGLWQRTLDKDDEIIRQLI